MTPDFSTYVSSRDEHLYYAREALAANLVIHANPNGSTFEGDPYFINSPAVRSPYTRWYFAIVAEWLRCGLPIVEMGHKYGAALMSTSPPTEGEIHPPWPAFMIQLPGGLIDKGHHLFVFSKNDVWAFIGFFEGFEINQFHRSAAFLANPHFEKEFIDDTFGVPFSDIDARLELVLSRLTLNVCLAMTDPAAVRPIGKGHKRPGGSGNNRQPGTEPSFQSFMLGRPIKIDCRPPLHDYIAGRRSSIKNVQSFVRGHWRHQPHGQGRALRRMQWIEPYWKGDENAPIAVKPHRL
jgi:hypothetical protein